MAYSLQGIFLLIILLSKAQMWKAMSSTDCEQDMKHLRAVMVYLCASFHSVVPHVL